MSENEGGLIAAHAWSMAGWPSPHQSTERDALEVWGYTDRPSYLPGETVRLHVSCSRPT